MSEIKNIFRDEVSGDSIEVFEEVKIVRGHHESGDIIELHFMNDVLHSLDDQPSYRRINNETGRSWKFAWHIQGELRRPSGGPVVLAFWDNGHLLARRHNYDNLLDTPGPTYEEFDEETGFLIAAEHARSGVLYRADGPADYEIAPKTRVMTYEVWYKKPGLGVPHREDDAAIFFRNEETRHLEMKIWLQDGYLFRPDGEPPVEVYDPKTGEFLEGRWEHERYVARNSENAHPDPSL